MNSIVQRLTPSRWHSDKSRQLASKVKAKTRARGLEKEEQSRGVLSDDEDESVFSDPDEAYSDQEEYFREEEELLLEQGEITMEADLVGPRIEAQGQEEDTVESLVPSPAQVQSMPRINRADDPRTDRPVSHFGARDSSWTAVCHEHMSSPCFLSTSPRAVRRAVVSPRASSNVPVTPLKGQATATAEKTTVPTVVVTKDAPKQQSNVPGSAVTAAAKRASSTFPSSSPSNSPSGQIARKEAIDLGQKPKVDRTQPARNESPGRARERVESPRQGSCAGAMESPPRNRSAVATDEEEFHSPLDHLKMYEKMSAAGWELHKFASRLSQLSGQLRSLDLSWNWLKSVSNSQISQFSCLQYLSLRGNVLQHLPEPLGEVRTLLMLDLSYNALKSAPAGMKDAFPSLVHLNLSYNRISSGQWDYLSSQPHSELTKAKKAKREKVFASLALPPSLKVLDVSNNRISSLPWSWFSPADPEEATLPPGIGTPVVKEKKRRWTPGKKQVEQQAQVGGGLTRLYVSHNSLIALPSWLPAASPALEVLWVRGNSLGVPYLEAVALDKEKRGTAHSTEAAKAFWAGIRGLKSLRELSLGGNFISDALWTTAQTDHVWSCLPCLELLDMSDNAIATVPEDLFSRAFTISLLGIDEERQRLERIQRRQSDSQRRHAHHKSVDTSRGRSKSVKEMKSSGHGGSLPGLKVPTGLEDTAATGIAECETGDISDGSPATRRRKRAGTVCGSPLPTSSFDEDNEKPASDEEGDSSSEVRRKEKRRSVARLSRSVETESDANSASCALPCLRVLNLSKNRISRIPAEVFSRLRGLQYLNVAHNLIDDLPKEVLLLGELRHFYYHRYTRIPANTSCMSKQLSPNDIVKEAMPHVDGPHFTAALRAHMPHLKKISLTVVACTTTVPEVKMTPKQFAWLPQICEILPGLFLTSEFGARREHHLASLGITHILSVITGFDVHYPSDYEYLVHKVEDVPSTNLRRFFAETNAFIDAGRRAGGVLVHCAAGVSRSATLCAAYIVHTQKITTRRAISMMHAKRPIVGPNSGFVHQLFDYEMMVAKVGPKVAEDPQTHRAARQQYHQAAGSGAAVLQSQVTSARPSSHASSPASSPRVQQRRVEQLKRGV